MRNLMVRSAVLFVALAATACDRHTVGPTSPTTTFATEATTGAAATSLSVAPTTFTTQPVANPSCPAVPPFNVPFQLFVQAGDVSTSITGITMQFGDRLGVQMPPVTLPAPALTAQFGSMLVQARSVLTLPLSLSIGCGTGLPGTLVVIVSTRDTHGFVGSSQVSVSVH